MQVDASRLNRFWATANRQSPRLSEPEMEMMEIWYKMDRSFGLPRANVMVRALTNSYRLGPDSVRHLISACSILQRHPRIRRDIALLAKPRSLNLCCSPCPWDHEKLHNNHTLSFAYLLLIFQCASRTPLWAGLRSWWCACSAPWWMMIWVPRYMMLSWRVWTTKSSSQIICSSPSPAFTTSCHGSWLLLGIAWRSCDLARR